MREIRHAFCSFIALALTVLALADISGRSALADSRAPDDEAAPVQLYLPNIAFGNSEDTDGDGTTQLPQPTETKTATTTAVPTSAPTQKPTTSPEPTEPATPTPTPNPTLLPTPTATDPSPDPNPVAYRVNAPYFAGATVKGAQAAILWFGQVGPTNNYVDVRIGYSDEDLVVTLHIVDRRLWYSTQAPSAEDLASWDAATLYLNLDGSPVIAPTERSFRFTGQLTFWEPRDAYRAAYQGNGSAWVFDSAPFATSTFWRGDAPNTEVDDRGWSITFAIPFASLGSQGVPAASDVWRLGLVVHDRDDAAGTPLPELLWPDTLDPQQPASWGQLAFELPLYTPPPTSQAGDAVILRDGSTGVQVEDAHVGGHTVCGQSYWPNFFDGWGDANYASYDQVSIQNQWDVADWPCFSKYYVTFPTDSLPTGRTVISATLTMHLFGSAGYEAGQAQPSLIQVLSVADHWDEATISWNNAPLATENVAAAWVNPVDSFPGWPGVPYTWDVSRAVAAAYARHEPVRLVLYSADSAYHSGKYFVSSDTGDWNAVARPTLRIWLGEAVSP